MKKFHCFLICGENGVGKTTTAHILQEITNYPVYNFADSLKEFFAKDVIFGASIENRHMKELVRPALISLANDFKAVFGKDFFAREVYRRMGEANRCIIGDLRFAEELEFIEENFITYDIIYITKDIQHEPTKQFPFLADKSIYLIENTGTLEELREKIDSVYRENKYKCSTL